ncbi:MAG: cytochrome C oxidase subunit IV family protein [Chitinophagaceae bacterium]|nr:cytochrome C oxidase subunit IV family protein [Bacteroidota bacterium]MCC6258791.1 cytochrome C oxidase subunit IV family protein [Chitinophagaceae bacterium]MCW5917773.1 cytochrome C oxidase subunit IV family protein [Ferruginibacter sp.]
MSQHTISPEITYHSAPSENTKRIWKTFWILSVITLVELGIGLAIYNIHKEAQPNQALVHFFKGMVTILTLAKAYYIISVFMHLGDEIRNFILSIAVPMSLFVWFIISMIWEGDSWRNLKNTDAGSRPAKTEMVKPAAVQPGAPQ